MDAVLVDSIRIGGMADMLYAAANGIALKPGEPSTDALESLAYAYHAMSEYCTLLAEKIEAALP